MKKFIEIEIMQKLKKLPIVLFNIIQQQKKNLYLMFIKKIGLMNNYNYLKIHLYNTNLKICVN